jgi:hypothetical protein
MPPQTVALTPAQVDYIQTEVNAAGADEAPPWTFESYLAQNTKFGIIASYVEGTNKKTIGEKINVRNGWETDPELFKQAVADVIHELDKDWGPFPPRT